MIKVLLVMQCDNCQNFFGWQLGDLATLPERVQAAVSGFLNSTKEAGWQSYPGTDICPTCGESEICYGPCCAIPEEQICPCCR